MATLTLDWMRHPPADFTRGAVTVGNFDGVHLGHRALIESARHLAEQVRGPVVAVTFEPPPIALLNPPALQPPLTLLPERAELLHRAGATHVVALKTDPGLLALSPEAFFEDVLQGLFQAKAVVEGYNFRFGRARTGDTTTLRNLCSQNGLLFTEVPPLLAKGEVISSSRIRSALNAGDVAAAAQWLQRDYSIEGVVVGGAKRGRTIGFPTANLAEIATLLPANGVYAVRAKFDGQVGLGAANLGPNPTFGEAAQKLEVHLLDFTGDLYGRRLRVEFVARLRETRPFSSVEALLEQLRNDVAAARLALA